MFTLFLFSYAVRRELVTSRGDYEEWQLVPELKTVQINEFKTI